MINLKFWRRKVSGKTPAGLFQFKQAPWIILDYKGDGRPVDRSSFMRGEDEVEAFLKKVWHKGLLTQRPMDITKYNFSEASHHVIFRLNDQNDRMSWWRRALTKILKI